MKKKYTLKDIEEGIQEAMKKTSNDLKEIYEKSKPQDEDNIEEQLNIKLNEIKDVMLLGMFAANIVERFK